MAFLSFLQGLGVGFAIAAPVGPIGILCIRRTLAEGRLTGFLSGLGAASADAFYGSVAAFGLTLVQDLLLGQQAWFRLIGGIILLYLGFQTMFSTPEEKTTGSRWGGLAGAYLSTLFLTLMNPITILSFAAVFAGLRLVGTSRDYQSAGMLVLGVFLGSAAWWLTLSLVMGALREKFTPGLLVWVNRLAGVIIAGFGIYSLYAGKG